MLQANERIGAMRIEPLSLTVRELCEGPPRFINLEVIEEEDA